MVVNAGDEESPQQQDALNQLCSCYWYPVYAFSRRKGHGHHDAQDITQAFFSRFLQRNDFAAADKNRGKFRSYLLVSLKHFLANYHDWKQAAKRGGDQVHVPWDKITAEKLSSLESSSDESPEILFDRKWALILLERVQDQVSSDYIQSEKKERFEALKQFLPGYQPTQSYSEIAQALGISEGALRVELHRLKKKFSQRLREEIAHTVSTPIEAEEELRHLINILQ